MQLTLWRIEVLSWIEGFWNWLHDAVTGQNYFKALALLWDYLRQERPDLQDPQVLKSERRKTFRKTIFWAITVKPRNGSRVMFFVHPRTAFVEQAKLVYLY